MSYTDLTKTLKNAPQGTKLYSPIFGNVALHKVTKLHIQITSLAIGGIYDFNADGTYMSGGECLLFPSKNNQDWSTFKLSEEKFKINDYVEVDDMVYKIRSIYSELDGPLEDESSRTFYELMPLGDYISIRTTVEHLKKINSFDYKYLRPWDKILSRGADDDVWCADWYCNNTPDGHISMLRYYDAPQYLPVNPETVDLIGKYEQAPEFYRKAWEETDD